MKNIHLLVASAILLILMACSDDLSRSSSGYVEGEGEDRTTVFHLTVDALEGIGKDSDVRFTIIDAASHSTRVFDGTIGNDPDISVLGSVGAAVCKVRLGTMNISDGVNIVRISGENIPEIGDRTVRFSNNVGSEEPRTVYADLSGEGTEQSPYLINDDADFQSFIFTLLDDETHAYGLYFKQTDSFDVPHRSMIIDGKIWAPTSFSGVYDGGGNELRNLAYQGSSDVGTDSNIGLFSQMFDATVKNLNLTNAMILYSHSNIGVMAGTTQGDCVIENVAFNGSIIASGNNIGGLVGENNGSLTLKGVTINSLAVSTQEAASENVGLLVGSSHNGNLTIEQVYTPQHVFSVIGARHVGGLVGKVLDSPEITVKNVTLEHSVDSESLGTKIINGTDIGMGGLFGWIDKCNNLSFERVSVKAPVIGHSDVGGLAGHAGNIKKVSVASTLLTSVVKADVSTGGFFGYLGLDRGGSFEINGTDGTTRYVLKSSAEAEVAGGVYTGGLIGYFDANKGNVRINSKTEIAVNVHGTEKVGGLIGFTNDIESINIDKVNFSSKTMKVTATGNYCGGVIGQGKNVNINGGNNIKPMEKIPVVSDVKGGFNGVVSGANYVGGIVGHCTGTLTGLGSAANVTSTYSGGNAGGIVGYFEGKATSCCFTGDISSDGNVGGIIGSTTNNINVYDCANIADLRGGENLGGIIGYLFSDARKDMKFDRCYNSGNLKDAKNIGGILAYSAYDNLEYAHLVITFCRNDGNINAVGDANHGCGGIAGFNGYFITEISHCSNRGDIHASTVMYSIGGIVGVMGEDKDKGGYYVKYCLNKGKVSCDVSSTKLGGVVGHIQEPRGNGDWEDSRIEDCRNDGDLPGNQKDDTGGILGFASHHSHIDRCYNAGMVSHGNAIVGTHTGGSKIYHSDNYYYDGTGKSWPSAIMVNAGNYNNESTYHNFDFNKYWEIKGSGPELKSYF